jgi:hypothetical protein
MRLVDAAVPRDSRRAGDCYREAVAGFLAEDLDLDRVLPGSRPAHTLYMGLWAAIRQQGVSDRVAVHRRGDDVFLLRLRTPRELLRGLVDRGRVAWGSRYLRLPASLTTPYSRLAPACELLASELPGFGPSGPCGWDSPSDAWHDRSAGGGNRHPRNP